MSEHRRRSFFDRVFVIGTPECAIFGGVAAMALGLLLLLTGFWNTLWISLLTAAGFFLGGVKEKRQWLKDLVNRLIPDKKTVPFRDHPPEIVRAVREATEKRAAPAEEKENDPGQDA